MRTNICKTITWATLGIVMSGCSDDAATENQKQTTELQVLGQISHQTRAVSKNAWTAGDVMGLYLTKADGTVRYADVRYTTASGDGAFEATGEERLHVTASDGEMALCGYHPCPEHTLTDHVYTVSTWTDNGTRTDLDLLWGKQTCSASAAHVRLTLQHQMTKLVLGINVVDRTQNPYSTLTPDSLVGMTVSAEGLNYPVSVDLLTGEATLGQPIAEALDVPLSETGTAGELIFAPGITAPGRQLTFLLPNDRRLVWHIADSKVFEAGKAYQYDLTLSSTSMEVEATIEGEIVAWEDGGTSAEVITPDQR